MLYNYFIHPSNLSKMDAVLKMRMALGAAGYGLYVQLLELLRDAPDYAAVLDAPVIAWALHEADSALVERVIREFGLFTVSDDGRFSSPWLSATMADHDERRAKYAAAGRKSAAARASKAEQAQSHAEQGSNDVAATLPPPLDGGQSDVADLAQQKEKQKRQGLKNKKDQPSKDGEGMGDLFDQDLIASIDRASGPLWAPSSDGHMWPKDGRHNPDPLSRIAVKYKLNKAQAMHIWRCCRQCEISSPPFMALLAADKHCDETKFVPTRPFAYFVSRIAAAGL